MSAKDANGPTKLKRKESPKVTAPVDVSDAYQKVNEYEEKVATQLDEEDDAFLNLCDEFSDIINEIADLKLQGKVEIIEEKQTEGSLVFVMLKKLNRLEKLKLKNNRDKLNETKRQVDNSHLQLQNLLYEIYHLKKEISKCLQFTSRNESVELISVDKFYEEAPESIARPECTRQDEHQLKLARLQWELEQRKTLAERCQQLEEEKQNFATAIKTKQVCINNLGPMIKDILKVTKPVQEYLDLSTSHLQTEPELYHLLPCALYFLCVQIEALRESCDSLLNVKVVGNKEESEQFKAVTVDIPTIDDDSDSDSEDNKVRRRKKTQVQVMEEKITNLFVRHPLSVQVTVSLKDGRSISILFVYYVNLEIVAVFPNVNLEKLYIEESCRKLLDTFEILNAIFADDNGDQSPNIANHYQFQQLGVEFNKYDNGIPYMWAQNLCGLKFPYSPASGNTAGIDLNEMNTQKCTISTIKAIRKRLEVRLDLCYQISHIEKLVLPVDLCVGCSSVPVKVNTKLIKWELLSWESYQQLPYTSAMIEENIVSSRDVFFKATFMNGCAFLFAAVVLKSNYPSSSSVYSIQIQCNNTLKDAKSDNNIRDMEKELNVYYEEHLARLMKPVYLLTTQLYQLAVCFDIYLQCMFPSDYPKDKLFTQSFRNRTRNLPLKYVHQNDSGMFIQR